MKILRVISKLIDYPTSELYQHQADIIELVENDEQLTDVDKKSIIDFISHRFNHSLLDWQADYDGLFERGRSLSLLIYEHIHGESRDRGQAMVDLLEQYKTAGLNISTRELPDYIPLFLEFASTQGNINAKSWLQDIAPILALLAVRLEQRKCNYSVLFNALVSLSEVDIDLASLREKVSSEKRDDTNKALDKVWEEEAVTFGGDAINGGCPSQRSKPSDSQRRDQDVPIQFVDAVKKSASTTQLRG